MCAASITARGYAVSLSNMVMSPWARAKPREGFDKLLPSLPG
jgi:hypothetical protein